MNDPVTDQQAPSEPQPRRFVGRRVVVTGAAGGVGRSLVELLRAEGAHVVATDVAAGDPALGLVPADLGREEEIAAFVARALDELGGLDVLCNVAGVQRFTPVGELTAAELRRHLDVNAVGPLLLTQGFVDALAASRGNVVSIASISALMGQPYNAAYCASKAALLLGMRALAVELAGRGIRVNCVSPGGIDTPMVEGAARSLPAEVDWNLIAKSQSVIPGFMPPGDVAQAVLFLASEAASSITGANLVVDRGVIW